MLTLTPRRAPAPTVGSRQLRVATWNCTGSDDAAKLEQIAELVWGGLTRPAFSDIVVIQEFTQKPKITADYKQLRAALKKQGWEAFKSSDEGENSSSHRCYFVVWNPQRLVLKVSPAFITDLTAPVLPPIPPARPGARQRKPVRLFDPAAIGTVNNPPMVLGYDVQVPFPGPIVPVSIYTWHTSPTFSPARVGRWPTPRAAGPIAAMTPAQQLRIFGTRTQVLRETQAAINGARVLVLAGDLNVSHSTLTAGMGNNRVPFPRGLGFRVVSGGGSGLDHIVACYGLPAVTQQKSEPGKKIGDHRPLATTITL